MDLETLYKRVAQLENVVAQLVKLTKIKIQEEEVEYQSQTVNDNDNNKG